MLFIGSGDYNDEDEYYDEDYDYEEEGLGDVEKTPPSPRVPVTLPTQKPTTATISTETSTHPHRHHHGEVNPSVAVNNSFKLTSLIYLLLIIMDVCNSGI